LGSLEDEVRRLRAQVDELSRQVHDLSGFKARLTQENFELHRQVQELDTNNGALTKAKTLLQQQLDDAKNRLDEESRASKMDFSHSRNYL
jgi:chromosome segregation ATPase